MAEAQRPEVARFINGLVPIKGVDFNQPWKKIVEQVNPQLRQLRFEQFKPDKPIQVALSNLDNQAPANPDSFDPFFVAYAYDINKTPQEIRATARLGLQAAYWQDLTYALQPMGHDDLPYENWQKFVVLPVFVKGKKTYLNPSTIDFKTIRTIQYGGDNDMIESARTRVFTGKQLKIPFTALEIPDQWLDEYIDLREKKHNAEEVARHNAVLSYRDNHREEWGGLMKLYPKIDEIVNRKQTFRFNFMDLADELIKEWAASAFADSPQPHTIKQLQDEQQLGLANFFFHRINPVYGIKLFREGEFYSAVKALGRLTNSMYESALDSLK